MSQKSMVPGEARFKHAKMAVSDERPIMSAPSRAPLHAAAIRTRCARGAAGQQRAPARPALLPTGWSARRFGAMPPAAARRCHALEWLAARRAADGGQRRRRNRWHGRHASRRRDRRQPPGDWRPAATPRQPGRRSHRSGTRCAAWRRRHQRQRRAGRGARHPRWQLRHAGLRRRRRGRRSGSRRAAAASTTAMACTEPDREQSTAARPASTVGGPNAAPVSLRPAARAVSRGPP